MRPVDTAILLARAAGAFAHSAGIFKVEETPYDLGSNRVAEAGHYSTLERAIKEVVAMADGALMADEGENPHTGEIEPYVHFVDLEDLMCDSGRPNLVLVDSLMGSHMTYRITFIKLDDDEEPGT